jgi:putative peptidoglycan lipid II flippase
VVLGLVDVAVFLVLARAMRLREVTDVIDVIVRRLPGARAS